MSLNIGLNMAYRGLQNAESQINVASQNITNANKPGYTRKTFDPNYITTNAGTAPVGGSISSSLSKNLLKSLFEDMTIVGKNTVVSEYMDMYVQRLGNVTTDHSASSTLNNMLSNLGLLAATPENPAQKSQIVSDATVLADILRSTSKNIQGQRLQADKEIAEGVAKVNALLERVDRLNERIVTTNGNNDTTIAELEDQRAIALEEMAELIDFSYYYTEKNEVQIYQKGGQPLLLSEPHRLEFTSVGNLNSGDSYPGALSGIEIDGIDVTSSVRGGILGGLLEMRDTRFVQEQEKMDEFANQLMNIMNGVLNQGAAIPPRTEMRGDKNVAPSFTANGSVRIALTDNSGTVQSFTDLNISGITTTAGMVSALNGIAGINASISADGELLVNSTVPGQGISINEMTSTVGPDGQGFSDYFGLNNLFKGEGAENIRVAEYLVADPGYLATGSLSPSATLAVGDTGIARGDVSITNAMTNAINGPSAFSAAGDFPAQSVTLSRYIDSIISTAALNASVAEEELNISTSVFEQTYDFVKNETGVNIDEETAKLLELENYYQSSATVIATLRELFQELIIAVR